MRPLVLDGGTSVVTGAAGGIGRAVALELAERGSHLVLLDRDADGLASLRDELALRRPDVQVTTYVVDLSDRDATVAVAQEVRDHHPRLTLLVNNAGVALGGRFTELSLDDVDWLLAVNLEAVLVLTHELLPCLLDVPGSHIVVMSSLFGLIAPGGQTAYATSKFAVRGFAEALSWSTRWASPPCTPVASARASRRARASAPVWTRRRRSTPRTARPGGSCSPSSPRTPRG